MSDIALHLYKNKKTENYLIQRFAGIRAAGKFINLSDVEMRERGLNILLSYLKDEPSTESEKPELATMSQDEKRAFYRNHRHLDISFRNGGAIKIGPLHRKGSGFIVPRDEVIELSPSCSNGHFLEAVERAFAEL